MQFMGYRRVTEFFVARCLDRRMVQQGMQRMQVGDRSHRCCLHAAENLPPVEAVLASDAQKKSTHNHAVIVRCKLLDFHWANFGWGKDTSGNAVHHPGEVWLCTCTGDSREEWHKETPVKLVFPLNYKVDGALPRDRLSLIDWVASKSKIIQPISHNRFESCTGPLPPETAKQRDLRTLPGCLGDYLSQAAIDLLCPEPESDDDSAENESDSDSEEGSEGD
jgi:hypothetical protein